MYKITIKTQAITDYPYLYDLHRIHDNDDFTNYLDNNSYSSNLEEGSYLKLEYNPSENKLYSVVEYISNRELNKDELDDLLEYTLGQLSDGIGEGFEQNPCYITNNQDYIDKKTKEILKDNGLSENQLDEDDVREIEESATEVYVSPWVYGLDRIISQNKI